MAKKKEIKGDIDSYPSKKVIMEMSREAHEALRMGDASSYGSIKEKASLMGVALLSLDAFLEALVQGDTTG